MRRFKKVHLSGGPCDGWRVELNKDAADYITNNQSLAFSQMRYEYAYNSYYEEVFTYRGAIGEQPRHRSVARGPKGGSKTELLLAELRSSLDVAALDVDIEEGVLTLSWRWRIHGISHAFDKKLNFDCLFSRRDANPFKQAKKLHHEFLVAVGRSFHPSADTNKKAANHE